MCGIFGHIGEIPERLAIHCTDTLSHRGPDGRGLWRGGSVTLGHRRLSILDLSDQAKQPMSYAGERYWITYNGEIYNFIEIRAELLGKGHAFRSDSDTEVLLAAYSEWGEECLLKFNGMWAFAIWDTVEQTLFLARDRFGKKPLFYAFPQGHFAFASEMKALFPLLDELNLSSDFAWMSRHIFQYETTVKCLIEGIIRFPAGHCGYFKDGRLSLKRYWYTLDHLVELPASYEEQVEQFRDLFIDACRIRMRSDVPVGTALSGGLDSSAIISTMAQISKDYGGVRMSDSWQHAFIATFPGTPLDESYFAQKVVENIGIGATYLPIDPLKDLHSLDDYFYKFEELYITSPIPMVHTYKAIKEHGISVTLDGHGADELMAGYGRSLFEAFLDCGLDIAAIKNIAATYRELTPAESKQFARAKNNSCIYLKFIIVAAARILLCKGGDMNCKDRTHPNFNKLDHFNRHLYQMVHDTVLPTLLRNYDRYSMTNGVEIRMPFMDHRIVAFLMSLPWDSKIRGGFTKRIARDAVSPYLPEEIAFRKSKIGFNSPIVDWMKNEMREYFLDILNSREFNDCALIDASMVRKQIENVINNKNAKYLEGEKAWTALVPFLWEKSVLKRNYKWT